MPLSDQLMQGLSLMVLGMGIVLSFLIMLIGVMRLMSAFAQRYGARPVAAPQPVPPRVPGQGSSHAPDATVIAVISAAIARYRQRGS